MRDPYLSEMLDAMPAGGVARLFDHLVNACDLLDEAGDRIAFWDAPSAVSLFELHDDVHEYMLEQKRLAAERELVHDMKRQEWLRRLAD